MKLFIWSDPWVVSYGNSMLIVVAEDLASAKELAMSGKAYSCGQFEDDRIPMNAAQVAALPEPTRVVDLPCAEWHRWSE